MLEREELPIKINNDTPVCEVCGAILITTQERIIRRCPLHSQQT